MRDEAQGFTSTFTVKNKKSLIHRCAFVGALLLCLFSISVKAEDAGGSCARDSRVVEPCYDVHGRLRVWADLRAGIGIPKTKRIVEIFMPESTGVISYMWPPIIEKHITLDNEIWADYRVCPFTPQKPGVMQMVCIDSVSNMHVVSPKAQK